MSFVIILNIIFIIICLAYVILIAIYTVGWFKLKGYSDSHSHVSTKVSIIVPVRNEEKNILQCLKSIAAQSYPTDLFEIIIVDDSSTDSTCDLVNQFIKSKNNTKIKLITPDTKHQYTYKKNALSYAIKKAEGCLIITTDADCYMGNNWVFSIVSYYEKFRPKMIVGPVSFDKEDSFFKKLQSLEILSLISASAAAINLGKPIMCNGANLAYTKDAFNNVNGFNKDDQYVSGDDVFLLLKIKNMFGYSSVHFIKNMNAIVYTEAESSLKSFFYQRIRWTSKSKGYKDFSIIMVAIIVYMYSFSLLSGFVLSLFIPQILYTVLFLFLIKALIDFPILLGICNFSGRKKLLRYYLPLQAIYFVYITVIGALGNFVKFKWKDRSF